VLPFIYSNGLINEAETLSQDLAEYLTNDLRDLGVAKSDQSLAGYLYPTFRIFFGIQIILPQIQSGQSTDVSGLAGKIVLAKCQDRQTCRFNSTAYSLLRLNQLIHSTHFRAK
jgi:hypothetical protein